MLSVPYWWLSVQMYIMWTSSWQVFSWYESPVLVAKLYSVIWLLYLSHRTSHIITAVVVVHQAVHTPDLVTILTWELLLYQTTTQDSSSALLSQEVLNSSVLILSLLYIDLELPLLYDLLDEAGARALADPLPLRFVILTHEEVWIIIYNYIIISLFSFTSFY